MAGSKIAGDLSVRVIATPELFLALEPAWTRLTDQCPECSASQFFSYCLAGWRHVASDGGALAIIAIWRNGHLQCVWPMYTSLSGSARIARHLGVGSNEEFSGPVILDDDVAGPVTALALKTAKSLADVIWVYNQTRPGLMADLIEADGAPHHRGSVATSAMLVADLPDRATWLKTKSKAFRNELGRDRGRLARLGRPSFERVSGPAEIIAFVDWMFDRKTAFLDRKRIARSWIRQPVSREFFTALMSLPPSDRGVIGFALRLDDRIIAGEICLAPRTVECVMTAFDPRYAAYSPGGLVLEDVVDYAISKSADLDLRIGDEPYKRRWADRWTPRWTYVIAATPRGLGAVLVEKARDAIRAFRRKASPLARRLRQLGRG